MAQAPMMVPAITDIKKGDPRVALLLSLQRFPFADQRRSLAIVISVCPLI